MWWNLEVSQQGVDKLKKKGEPLTLQVNSYYNFNWNYINNIIPITLYRNNPLNSSVKMSKWSREWTEVVAIPTA